MNESIATVADRINLQNIKVEKVIMTVRWKYLLTNPN